jgi:hypothetical protein
MTIKEIKEDTIEQCCDNCGAVRELDIDALTLGVIVEDHSIPNVIRLPTCDQCTTIEYLFASEEAITDLIPHGSEGEGQAEESSKSEKSKETEEISKSPHQLLVDQLAEKIALLDHFI